MDVSVRGSEDLERLARNLKAAGAGDLRKELLKNIRASGKPLIADIKANAQHTLPHSGGLAALVAGSKFGVRTRLSGKSVGIRVQASNSIQVEGLDRGRLKHPVFGNRDNWVGQAVTPGFFSKPAEENVDTFRRGIEKAMTDVANQIERGV